MTGNGNGNGWRQLVVSLLVWLMIAGAGFGYIRAQVDNLEGEISHKANKETVDAQWRALQEQLYQINAQLGELRADLREHDRVAR